MFRCFVAAAALTLGLPALAQDAKTGPLTVTAAWARPTVPGQQGGGGFLKIANIGAADRLVSAKAQVSDTVELHTMTIVNDVMQMRQVSAIDVPANGSVELKPGGLHIMFIGLKEPLKTGTAFPLTLKFEKAGELTLNMQVTPRPAAAAAQEHKHH
jgi:periplasmic copper chaperone A